MDYSVKAHVFIYYSANKINYDKFSVIYQNDNMKAYVINFVNIHFCQ